MVGAGRRCTVVSDRVGYSPAVFTEIAAAGSDLLTYCAKLPAQWRYTSAHTRRSLSAEPYEWFLLVCRLDPS